LAAVLLAALVAVAAAGAKSGFPPSVCSLLTAKQVTALGATSKCTNQAPLPGPGSTQYEGDWAGTTTRSPSLQVTVSKYTDPGFLQRATQNLKQGLPGGPAKAVKGLGGPAYEATGGAGAASIHIGAGKYIAYITLTSLGSPPKSAAPLEPIAKAVAAELKND
jgi:hypothetical protein